MSDKKNKVIDVARELFTAYGYKRVTMDEIAKKSGVTKKTIYSYFKDKDDLIKYFVLEKIEDIKSIIEKIQKEDLPIDKKTHKIIYSILNYQKDEKLLRRLSDEAYDMPLGTARKMYDFVTENVLNELKCILDKAVENKLIKEYNTKLLSFVIYKVYFAVIFERKEELSASDIDEIIDFLNSGLIRGDNNE